MALIKCSECGSDVSEKASLCPKCGCPVDISKEVITTHNKKRNKKIIIGVVTLVVVAVIVFAIIKVIGRPNTDGFYDDTKWGMTAEQVKNILGDDAGINDDKGSVFISYEDYEEKNGIDALVVCDCTDDSLKGVTIFLTIGDDSSYTDSRLIDEYTERFNTLYGEGKKDSYLIFWNTSKSKIELSYLMKGAVVISYENITKLDE